MEYYFTTKEISLLLKTPIQFIIKIIIFKVYSNKYIKYMNIYYYN